MDRTLRIDMVSKIRPKFNVFMQIISTFLSHFVWNDGVAGPKPFKMIGAVFSFSL